MNDDLATFILGDCVEEMAKLDAESVDAVVTDPPYGLSFMGKGWDTPTLMTHAEDNPVCEECGNDVATEGYRLCPECLEKFAGKRQMIGHISQNWSEKATHSRGYADNDNRAYQAWCTTWATEAYRLLKPGGYLLAFGGTRTVHRLASAIEDAGFEIRDCLVWAYASGFPKSLDVSKAIDKAAGAEREVVRERETYSGAMGAITGYRPRNYIGHETSKEPATDAAKRWQGWGTALKPAWEPIVMARKPLIGTVAANVAAHGTGALNIDGTRIPSGGEKAGWHDWSHENDGRIMEPGVSLEMSVHPESRPVKANDPHDNGRWPANVILTDPLFDGGVDGVVGGGVATSGSRSGTYSGGDGYRGDWPNVDRTLDGDTGTYSRFFLIPKAARGDREPLVRGLLAQGDVFRGQLPDNPKCEACGRQRIGALGAEPCSCEIPKWAPNRDTQRANVHPTVKPVELMRHLVRLVTPPGGVVLDCFLGSGTTAIAANMEGFRCIGIEREAEYLEIARARMAHQKIGLGLDVPAPTKKRGRMPPHVSEGRQSMMRRLREDA